MKNFLTGVLFFITGLTCAASLASTPFNNIVVFGDSLSDNGNLYELMEHQLPTAPYYDGRFSNGPVWVEFLSEKMFPNAGRAHLFDYAYGGAGMIPLEEEDDSDMIFTLSHEVYLYLRDHNEQADPDTLYIIWIGANNYLNLPENSDAEIDLVISGIKRSMAKLADKGAKHILLLNLPDLGRTPASFEFSAEMQLSALVRKHNIDLRTAVDEFKRTTPQVQWLLFDVFEGVNRIMDQPQEYGFTNILNTCYDVDVDDLNDSPVLKMALARRTATAKNVCEGYLFFDLVHPTVTAHNLIANEVYDLLQAAR